MVIRRAIPPQIHLMAFWVRLSKSKLMSDILPELRDYLKREGSILGVSIWLSFQLAAPYFSLGIEIS